MVRRFWDSSGPVQGRSGASRGASGNGRIRGAAAQRRRCVAGDCARLLRQVGSAQQAAQFSWAAQQESTVNQLSLTGRTARRRQHFTGSPTLFTSRAVHCCGIPADRAASLTPAGVCLWAQPSVFVPHFLQHPPSSPPQHPPNAAPSTSLRKQLHLQRARPSPLLPLPPVAPACVSDPRAAALSARPPWICLHRRFRSRARRDTTPPPPLPVASV